MTGYHKDMYRISRVGLLLAAITAACTKANPAAKCSMGSCIDPSYPYCDTDGAISGTAGTCIAVTCTPGTVAECKTSDTALVCSADGSDYNELQCQQGCDPQVGCRTCAANQTVCVNGVASTCDASGNVTSQEMCPLGCFQDQPRCRDISPSNGLSLYLDMVATPPDLDLDNAQIDTQAGTITTASGAVDAPTFLVSPPVGGSSIRVFVANHVHIGNVVAGQYGGPQSNGPALAILASGDIVVDGRFALYGSAGGYLDPACVGAKGNEEDINTEGVTAPSGGGGNATPGGAGGSVQTYEVGGNGGGVAGTDELVPLRGGCPAGGLDTLSYGVWSPYGASGGGALQLASRTKITVTGAIAADGESGWVRFNPQTGSGVALTGGGAGGGILLEAPAVEIGPAGKLLARGGGGSTLGSTPTVVDDVNPMSGFECSSPSTYCGNGGHGASATSGAANGGNASFSSGVQVTAGGGGGGLGRLRINTPTGTFSEQSSSVVAAKLTTGTLATR
jgi:hypothetical protein